MHRLSSSRGTRIGGSVPRACADAVTGRAARLEQLPPCHLQLQFRLDSWK